MNVRVLVAAAVMVLAGLGTLWSELWPFGLLLICFAVWLLVVERSVGLGTFVRFDPWKPAARRRRRVRALLHGSMGLVGSALMVAAASNYPDPAAFAILMLVLLAAYTRWATSYMKTHGAEDEVTVEVRH